MAAATSIMRAQQIVQATVDEALRPSGLTFARYEALVLLAFSKRRRPAHGEDEARGLMIHPTSVTNIVDRLEVQGFRPPPAPSTGDRRTTLVEITDAGREVMDQATGERWWPAPSGSTPCPRRNWTK